ncbi:multidrug efflux SMR transporter [Sphingomonas sp. CFBP 13728]|uniref:DMT family transporter n=1 Tax=Sphingomonas sp. CFBP 13728 TaxID=2775294 RepID=UPI00177B3A53|nr:multidrug efflux SMR transporter [Sphingomonas sp. CFBP 13728]MBD8620436.1 multidrug efflux SMR transporter [Sphingomonas sp. CFBP 13728]
MAWIYLLLGGVFEVGFTTCLRYTDGFKNLTWTGGFAVCALLSFLFLEVATRTIPLGTGYAVWTGIGALGTVVIGMVWFGEPSTPIRILLILGLVACVAGLKLTSGH